MAPVITLTTDFGHAGPFVGVMKAVIAEHAPGADVHDLSHDIAPWQPGEAGFWLARCYRYFPAGSVHVVVVDPGVGTARAVLACAWDGHLFLAPDNGILPMIAGPQAALHTLGADWLARQNWPAPSQTFHGRDIFAPLAAAMLTGRVRPPDIGPRAASPVPAAIAAPVVTADAVTGRVAAIDRWGNLITNIEPALLARWQRPLVRIAHHELPIVPTYGAVAPGTLLALVNSFGVLEIAVREGNAAQLLGLGHGAEVITIDA